MDHGQATLRRLLTDGQKHVLAADALDTVVLLALGGGDMDSTAGNGNRLAMGTPAPLLPAWAAAPADAAALLLGWQVVGAATLGWGAAAATGAEAAALSLQGMGALLLLVMYTKLRSTVWRRSAAALLLACLSCPN